MTDRDLGRVWEEWRLSPGLEAIDTMRPEVGVMAPQNHDTAQQGVDMVNCGFVFRGRGMSILIIMIPRLRVQKETRRGQYMLLDFSYLCGILSPCACVCFPYFVEHVHIYYCHCCWAFPLIIEKQLPAKCENMARGGRSCFTLTIPSSLR